MCVHNNNAIISALYVTYHMFVHSVENMAQKKKKKTQKKTLN